MRWTCGWLAVAAVMSVHGLGEAATAPKLEQAPVNPAFVQSLESARWAAGAPEASFGYRPSPLDRSHLRDTTAGFELQAFASLFDLRTQALVTAVRNQNPYGTCWAHATFGSMESCLLPGETNNFSENNLVNLHGFDWGFNDGGNADMAMAYLARWNGPVDETSDAYPNVGGSAVLPPVRHVLHGQWIPTKTSATNHHLLKQALVDHGALYTSYYHDNAFYNSTWKSYYYTGTNAQNHAVTLVGWDDNYPSSRFASAPPGNGAYIVKNSWGTSWGESGYFYVSYYDTKFAYAELAAFYNAENTNTYTRQYAYDPLGAISVLGIGSTTFWGANLFTASASESLGAVGFYAPTTNTAYQVYVYTGCNPVSPTSGSLALSNSGTLAWSGYHTVPLSSTVGLTGGQRFSIVLRLTTPGYNYPQTYEYAYPGYSSTSSASSGQSFYSGSGSSWTDLTTFNTTANFCIKGYVSAPVTHTIWASAGPHGTVAPSGAVSVAHGANTSFLFTAEAYYFITNVVVDGSLQPPLSNFYWNNITADGTLTVAFAEALSTAHDTPEWWLAEYGLTNGGLTFEQAEDLDTDADGLTAWEEYVVGSVPTNPASRFEVADPTFVPGANILSWEAVPGRQYDIYWTPSLGGALTPLALDVVAGGYTDTVHQADERVYYRISVQKP